MCSDDRHLDEAGPIWCAINALRRLAVVFGLREEDIVDEGLRIAIVEREPARLDLHHDPVTRQEDMIRVRQRETIGLHLVGWNRGGMFNSVPITPTEDI